MAGWYTTEGAILSLGAEWIEEERAYNFSIYSEHAERVTLLLFGEDDPAQPLLEYRLDPWVNKTWHVWHCRLGEEMVFGARYYAYEIDGPRSSGPRDWHAFDPQKVLLDPYAKAVFFPPGFNRQAAERAGPNMGRAPLGILPRRETTFAWGDDRPPRHESDAVIYEMHVRGFTQSPTCGLAPGRRGTYAGVKEARMNVPGSPLGNWRWRCTDGMLSASDFQWLRDLTETSNRSFPHRSPCLSEVTP